MLTVLLLAAAITTVSSSQGDDDYEDDNILPWLRDSEGSDYSMADHSYPGWKDNVVPVDFDEETMRPDEIAIVKEVHKEMSKKISCIRFVPYSKKDTKHKTKLLVTKEPEGNGKSATVYDLGQEGQWMKIKFYNITDTPYNRMVLTHESLHVLGMGHTIKRKDRDKYIKLIDENITPEKKAQYAICERCDLQDIPYDCSSIMHYRRCRYGVEPCDDPKFEALDPASCNVVDMNLHMSETDIKLAKKINCKSDTNAKEPRKRWGRRLMRRLKTRRHNWKKSVV